MTENIQLLKILESTQVQLNKEAIETHLHQDHCLGASSVGSCPFLQACKLNQIELPPVTGLKADHSVLDLGNDLHDIMQYKLSEAAAQGKFTPYFFGAEVLIDLPVLFAENETYHFISPIDVAIADQPFEAKEHQFRNDKREFLHLPFQAHFIKIWDIKTTGMYSYFKILKEGLPFGYKAQGHIYMKAAGLSEITFLIINREKGWKYEIILKWDNEIWNKTISRFNRRIQLAKGLQTKTISLTESDFNCLDETEESIEWYSCPLSRTHEDQKDSGQPTLILDNFCEFAMPFVYERVKTRFQLMKEYTRGKSIITVDSISKDSVVVHNRSGKQYVDTLSYALQNYTPYVKTVKKEVE